MLYQCFFRVLAAMLISFTSEEKVSANPYPAILLPDHVCAGRGLSGICLCSKRSSENVSQYCLRLTF